MDDIKNDYLYTFFDYWTVDDFTFTSSQGKSIGFGVAGDCYSSSNCPQVNLLVVNFLDTVNQKIFKFKSILYVMFFFFENKLYSVI